MQGVGPGSLLGGRYLVGRRITSHTRYERWTAADQVLDRDVVLLCFDARAPFAAATLDAARRAAGVGDPRLVRILDVTGPPANGVNPAADSAVGYVVEDPLTGAEPLTQGLASGGLPAEEARRIVGESASALENARSRGLHHGALTTRSVFRLPDGSVTIRGLATEAALLELDDLSADEATRADTIALVAIGYASLTARWPLAGTDSGLEAAPRMVGGVVAPSEIAAGVPTDLDLVIRSTLSDDAGPRTPGDLAASVGPWSPTPVSAASVLGGTNRPGTRTEPLARDRTTGGVDGVAGAGGPPAAARGASAGPGRSVLGVPLAASGVPRSEGASEEGDPGHDDGTVRPGRAPAAVVGAAAGAAAAGTAVARGFGTALGAAGGLASTVGDRVGGLARGAADRAAERSAQRAERRTAEEDGDLYAGAEDVRLSDTLEPADDDLGPVVPLLRGSAQEPLDQDHSRLVLVLVGAAVLLAAVLGVWGLPRLSGISASAGPAPVVTATVTATASTTSGPAASAAAPTSSAPATAAPLAIASASQISQDAGVQASRTGAAAFDGNPGSVWRSSKWYATAAYGGLAGRTMGLLVDLGQSGAVHQVNFTLRGAAGVSVLVGDRPTVDGAQTIGSVNQDGDASVSVPNGGSANGRYVILWFTSLGPDGEGHFRAQVAEVSVT